MTKRGKLTQRFLLTPNDFSWQELVRLLEGFEYRLVSGGKTGGSRARFIHQQHPPIILHKPYPKPILKKYQMNEIRDLLQQEKLL